MRRLLGAVSALSLTLALLGPSRAHAQGTKTVSEGGSTRTKPQKKDERRSYGGLAVPAVYYSPETKLAAGIAGFLFFRLPGETLDDRPSNVDGDFIYTVNKQLLFQVTPTIYMDHGRFLIESEFSYEKLFDRFWGIGPNTPKHGDEAFNYSLVRGRLGLSRQLAPYAYFGMQAHAEEIVITDLEKPDGQLARNPNVLGRGGSFVTGLGFRFVYDSRDNYFSTRKGAYAAVQGMFYAEALGGTHSYSLFTVDVRKYLPLWFGHTLALQAYGASTYWDVPFSHLPILGGQFRMRGYFEGRFRGNNAVITQAEYRFPIAWRFGGVAFGSVGMVAPSLLDFKLKDIKGAAGGGLRFMFDRDERLNGRFDVGVSNEGEPNFYIQINEAF